MSDDDELPAESGELADDFVAARPDGEPLARAKLLARLDTRLFGAPEEPVKLGRFVIVDRLGAGGMGVVYKAYDPQLDRRVALKLVTSARARRDGANRPEGAIEVAHRRLLREAQALARLSHPNVVPVHEVGVLGDQVFVVMEFVVGRTLDAWVEAEAPSWRDVLATYLQAGRGLAAAHDSGLVHRDFKPANAIIGDDRRVRVLDFGLARDLPGDDADAPRAPATIGEDPAFADTWAGSSDRALVDRTAGPPHSIDRTSRAGERGEAEAPARPGSFIDRTSPRGSIDTATANLPPAPLTASDAIVGTPAYMSPEQLAGGPVGPQSDQFSFCVALYQALYGARPYDGSTLPELAAATRRGQVRPPPPGSSVPGWLHPILCRGLRPGPDERYPSMDALLAALEDDPVRRRRQRIAAVAVSAVVAMAIGVAAYSLARPASMEACADTGAEIAATWTPEHRAAIRRAVESTGLAYAGEAWPRIAAGLDGYARDWADMRREACLSHQRGLQSGELLDRRMACLDGRHTAMVEAISVLAQTKAEFLANSVQVVHKLPAIARCGDVRALTAQLPPPADRERARRVAALRDRLSRAIALENAGRLDAALAIARAVAREAAPLDYPPVLAEALLVVGRIELVTVAPADSIARLHEATTTGLAAGVDAVALEAIARRVYAEAIDDRSSVEHKRAVIDLLVSLGESLAGRVADGGFGLALLLNNTGVAHLAQKNRARARDYLERALAVKDGAGLDAPELQNILRNLALVSPDPAKRRSLLERVLAEYERGLGPSHRETLHVRAGLAWAVASPQAAHAILAPACRAYELHPDQSLRMAECVHYLAFLDAELGERARAAAGLERLQALLPDDASPGGAGEYPSYLALASGYAALYRGRPADALAPLTRVGELLADRAQYWWIEKRIADSRLGLGLAQLALGRYQAAIASLDAARSVFERVATINHNADTPRKLALARVSLATALWRSARGRGKDQDRAARRARVEELAEQARAWYREAGAGYERRLRELDGWPGEIADAR